jgi:hypothetical protein
VSKIYVGRHIYRFDAWRRRTRKTRRRMTRIEETGGAVRGSTLIIISSLPGVGGTQQSTALKVYR